MSGQPGTATPFMKVGDVSHSGKKVSFNADPIEEQLENLTSMVYNMSIQKEENNRPLKPKIYPKRRSGQGRQNFSDRDRNRPHSRDRQRQNFRPNYRGQSQNRHIQHGNDNRRGSYGHQNYNNNNRNDSTDRERQNFRRSFGYDRSRSRGRCLTPRGNGNRRNYSPNANLGTRSRPN